MQSRILILLDAIKNGPVQTYENAFNFLLSAQDLGMDNGFEEIWQKLSGV